MKKLKHFLAGLFVVTAFSVSAQTTVIPGEEKPFIEVNGTSEFEVVPDEIYINVIIRERFVNKDKITVEEQEANLKNALRKIGLDLSNLYLANANADFVRIRFRKKGIITQKDYTLKVTDAVTVGKVFDELDSLEITDAYIAKTTHSKMDSLRREVKTMAIKAAKAKADYLLAAIGEQTGKPLIVRENEYAALQTTSGVNYRGGREESNTRYYLDGVQVNDKSEEIQFQKIKLQTGIYVKFLIK